MPGEDTRTGVALSKADDEIFDYDGGARLKATRLIIVFTDGLSMDKPTLAAKALRRKGVKIYTISVNSIGFVPEMLGIVGDADNVFGPTDEDRIEERLLGEVESSRSCEIQPKKNEKTTSSFGWRITDAAAIVSPVTEASVVSFNTTTESTSESTSTTIASLNSSFESNESENSVENIGHNETAATTTDSSLIDVVSTVLPTSHTWKEPVQLFTVETESTHENKVLNLTNLKTSLAEESNTSEAKDKTEVDQDSTSAQAVATKTTTDTVETSSAVVTIETKTGTRSTQTEVSKDTVVSTTVSTTLPPGTTICINPPTSTPSSPSSAHFSTKSFLVKLGVKKEKKEKDPLSKFLGRDVPNSNSVKDETDLQKNKLDNSSVEKSSENSSETIEAKTPTSALPTSRFLFSTRVTFRPMSTSTTTKSTTPETTTVPSTKTSTTTTTTTTTPVTVSKKSLKTETTTESATSTPTQSPSFTPLAKSSLSLQTLSEVTAFPTLLSMEKARPVFNVQWTFFSLSTAQGPLHALMTLKRIPNFASSNFSFSGTTYIGAALELSLILLDSRRKHTETTVILISDGFSQDDSTQQAKLLRQLPNVKMYAISLNKLTNTKYLTDIVGDRKNLFINDESQWFEEFFTKKLRCVPTTR
ncbi:unnamed protein product [Caenorhabditis nigoni]